MDDEIIDHYLSEIEYALKVLSQTDVDVDKLIAIQVKLNAIIASRLIKEAK